MIAEVVKRSTTEIGSSTILVPIDEVEQLIRKLGGQGCTGKKFTPEEMVHYYPDEKDPDLVGLWVFHGNTASIESIMARIGAKRVR